VLGTGAASGGVGLGAVVEGGMGSVGSGMVLGAVGADIFVILVVILGRRVF